MIKRGHSAVLELLNHNDFDKVYEILEENFPVDEIRPYDKQRKLLENSIYQIYAVMDKSKDVVKAFVAVYELEHFVFLEHFAVNAQYRNQGLGGKILQELKHMSGKMICLEVEPSTTEVATRRIGFYKRNDFYLNDYTYMQPPLAANQKPVELKIMSSEKLLSVQEFETIKSTLFTEVYNAK